MDRLTHELSLCSSSMCSLAPVLRDAHPAQADVLLLGLSARRELRQRLRRKIRAARKELASREPACFCGTPGGPCVTLMRADGTLACNHEFHASCVMRWFESDSRCPVCRAPVYSVLSSDGQETLVAPAYQAPSSDASEARYCMACRSSEGTFTRCEADGCTAWCHDDCETRDQGGLCLHCFELRGGHTSEFTTDDELEA